MFGDTQKALMIASGKGGTGKTLLSANVAYALSKDMKVALVDADIRAPNLSYIMGYSGQDSQINNHRKIIPIKINDNLELFSPESYFSKPNGHKRAILPSDDEIKNIVSQSVRDVAWNDPDIFVFDTDPSTNAVVLALKEIFKDRLSGIVVTTNDISSAFDCERMIDAFVNREIKINGLIGNQIKMGEDARIQHIAKTFGVPVFLEIPYNDAIWMQNNMGNPYIPDFKFDLEWLK